MALKLRLSPRTQALGLDAGLLLLRLSIGAIFIYHGLPKLKKLSATAAGFEKMGLPLPTASALAAGTTETLGGALLILGLFTRPAAAAMTFTMLVAVWSTRAKGFDNRTGGYEFALSLGLTLAALLLTGPGKASADALLFPSKRP